MDALRMTRENKLALVIGFGLLLLAGIFVSDHLSAQQRMDEDPLIASEEQLVPESNILMPRSAAAATPVQHRRSIQTSQPAEHTSGGTREIVLGERVDAGPATPESSVHHVRKGETLTSIARNHYGDTDRVTEIITLNNIANPNALKVGTRLVLPGKGARVVVASNPAPPASRSVAASVGTRTIVVREGDTLGHIAKRELGSARKWQAIAKANQDVLPNPDRVKPGMTLKIPTTE